MDKPTARFSSRVANYIKYRPHYPLKVLEVIQKECGLTPEWLVADIGSGTGFLTELFLENGNPTLAVEPNRLMRESAETFLAKYPNFTSIDGTAEHTTLEDSSIDLLTVGQAFHWFDLIQTKQEFLRILRTKGWIVLVWNERGTNSPFMEAYESLLRQYATNYASVNHRNIDDQILADFFAHRQYQLRCCENCQRFDLAGLKGRFLSSSYAPEPGHPDHEPMMTELESIFDRFQENGQVVFEYETQVYFGRLK